MKLTKNVEIGMNALNSLKNKTEPTKVSDIASEIGATVHFLGQIMRNLKNANLVLVKRGPNGGYTLNRSIVGISAYMVARALGKFSEGLDVSDTGPASRLKQSVAAAFLNTVI